MATNRQVVAQDGGKQTAGSSRWRQTHSWYLKMAVNKQLVAQDGGKQTAGSSIWRLTDSWATMVAQGGG